jgi:uncharacterized protein (DUF433 family)
MIANAQKVVSSNPAILGGALVFAGTRVPVDTLVAHLKAGDTIETFLDDFPTVSRTQVEAYLDLATELIMENGGSARPA